MANGVDRVSEKLMARLGLNIFERGSGTESVIRCLTVKGKTL